MAPKTIFEKRKFEMIREIILINELKFMNSIQSRFELERSQRNLQRILKN